MRKYVLIGIAIFLALICILQVFFGFGIGKSYGAIKKAYRENINAKENLDKMNNEDYNKYQKQLNEAVAEFKTNQEQYEQRNAENNIIAQNVCRILIEETAKNKDNFNDL